MRIPRGGHGQTVSNPTTEAEGGRSHGLALAVVEHLRIGFNDTGTIGICRECVSIGHKT